MTDTPSPVDSGMRRQLQSFRQQRTNGMPRFGWKVGINDPAAQQRLGLSGPIVGWLDGRRVFPEGQPYQPSAGAKPRIEAETAIHIGRDVPGTASLDDARAAISEVAPAFEFVDGTKPLSPIEEMLAHDILHDGVMLGPARPLDTAAGLIAKGLPSVTLNGAPHRVAQPGRYPDDLAEIVLSVARTLGAHGEALLAGDWIIGGSYIDPFDLAPGDAVAADFGPLGALTVTCA
ncbi:MAG: hypothetical protein ABI577_17280 [bacterium]